MNSPLGPRSLEDIISGTFRLYRQQFLSVLGITALGYITIWVIVGIGIGLSLLIAATLVFPGIFDFFSLLLVDLEDPLSFGNNAQSYLAFFQDIRWGWLGLIAVVLIATIVAAAAVGVLISGAVIHAVATWELGLQPRVMNAYSFALKRLLALVLTEILKNLAMFAIVVALIIVSFVVGKVISPLLIVPAFLIAACAIIFLWISWSMALPIIILERRNPIDALVSSYFLAKENWWRIFGIILVITLIMLGLGLVMTMVTLIPYIGLIIGIVWSMLSGAVKPVVATSIYFDLRNEKSQPEGYTTDHLAHELGLQINLSE